MGTRAFFTFLTHFDFPKSGSVYQFFHGDMFSFFDFFRVFVSKLWVFVFRSILTYIFSFKADSIHDKDQSGCDNQIDSSCYKHSTDDEFGQEEDAFQVLDREHVNKTDRETENSVVMGSELSASTSKYQFLSERDISGFIEEPKTMTFSVQELYLGSIDPPSTCDNGFLDGGEAFGQEKAEESVETFIAESDPKKHKEEFTENENRVFTEYRFLHNYDYLLKDDLSSPLDFRVDTIGPVDGFSESNDNFGEGLEIGSLLSTSEEEEKEENIERVLAMRDQRSDSDDEFIELEPRSHNFYIGDSIELVHEEEAEESPPKLENSSILSEEILSSEDLNEADKNHGDDEDLVEERTFPINRSVNTEASVSDHDYYEDDDEFSLEHEELLEQLKMELKYARTGGLATIEEETEEFESPKMAEELKPLQIDQKFERKDLMLEIHKFYRSYIEKMRKLEILKNQTMHAISLLQLKEPCQLIKTKKSSVPAILTQNLRLFKPRKHELSQTVKLTGDLQKEFELVYVGQLCLSWEILHWQYRKAFELHKYESRETRHYNQVAGEFQLFQVLLQRFIEDEPFQGLARVQNYVNNWCGHCNFLHVPVIKDDSMKDKNARRRDEEDAITSAMLTGIIEESMRVFWEFLRADKDGASDVISRGPELQDSIDLELLTDIRTDFQKKDKRFKEIVRSGSCIVKKFQKHHEDQVRLHHAMFLAQVELRLVSRVLNMSKLTADQLLWCHEKLANINFCNRKLLLEPSFLLFPC